MAKRTLNGGVRRGLFWVLMPCVIYFPTAFAQAPEAGALQQQLQREIERSAPRELPLDPSRKAPTPVEPSSNKDTIEVKRFSIFGSTLIEQSKIDRALAPYENRELTFDQIREAASAVTALYTQIGRTAQAVIPPQDVVDGVIKINILEGRVGKVIIELDKVDPGRLRSSVIQKTIAASNPENGFVNLIGLERSLALLNELPGNQSTAQLSTGDREGSTDIIVSSKSTGIFSARTDLSNYGSASTGVGQAIASLNLLNPSGYGDQASLDVIGSEGSVYGQFKYSVPIGTAGWKIAAGASALDYKSLSSFSPVISQGNAQTYGLYGTYALSRSAKSISNFVVNLENKNYLNNSNQIESSRYRINDLTIGINGSKYLEQDIFYWGLNAVIGSVNIGNTNQLSNDQNGAATNGSFVKLTFNGAYSTPLPVERTNATFSLYGQLANKNLNSAEQLYLGGPYGVRAYPVAQAGGAQGAIASAEITHTFPGQLQVGGFFDAGVIQQYVSTWADWQGQTRAGNVYPLYAAGLTAKYVQNKFQVSAILAFRVGANPLYNSTGQPLNVDNNSRAVQGWIKATYLF